MFNKNSDKLKQNCNMGLCTNINTDKCASICPYKHNKTIWTLEDPHSKRQQYRFLGVFCFLNHLLLTDYKTLYLISVIRGRIFKFITIVIIFNYINISISLVNPCCSW